MVNTITQILPWGVLVFNIAEVILLLALISRKSWGKDITHWVGRQAISLGLLTSIAAVAGSLFYSGIVGFEPCYLCWWQRITIFPLVVLFLTALKDKDREVFKYVWRLSVLTIIISLYNSYIQFGGNPIIPCPVSGSCSKLYVYAFHYVTIPTMALSIAIMMLLLAWADKVYQKSR